MKISLGKSDGRSVQLDLEILLRTRGLIQSDSGGGKTWLLRRIAEQAFGKVQIIIVDPEGEFATLREKYGYVLVGKGGETPADTRSAALVATKLLELRASAVCDIYELKPVQRHAWVRLFLESLIDAPKNLWHPVLVIVDEAHVYCPEKGKGESEASGAMSDLCTRGRKRGYCALFATQRLGTLNKDASSMLQNRMIGPTFEDINRKRAADTLGILKADERKFFKAIQLLEPGNFYCLGRAISTELLLVRVGGVETTHPELGSGKHSAEPPPPPDKVKALLPKLADLPKAAEEQARTTAELRKQIRDLKIALRQKDINEKKSDLSMEKGHGASAGMPRYATVRKITWEELDKALRPLMEKASEGWQATASAWRQQILRAVNIQHKPITLDWGPPLRRAAAELNRSGPARVAPPLPAEASRSTREARSLPIESGEGDLQLSRSQLAILKAIAEFDYLGHPRPGKSWVAARAGASYTSSTYTNNLGALRSVRLIDYPAPNIVQLTAEGKNRAPEIGSMNVEEIFNSCIALCTRSQARILQVLREIYPHPIEKAELAARAGASPESSSYTNNLGALRSAGMIDYPERGKTKCAAWIFLE